MPLPAFSAGGVSIRGLVESDAPALQRICEQESVARFTRSIPHPYPPEGAIEFIRKQADQVDDNTNFVFAVIPDGHDQLVGTVGLGYFQKGDSEARRAEMGYLTDESHRGKGFTTAGCRLLLRFGFETLLLQRIYACVFPTNPASRRVLEKIGMTHEGTARRAELKWGEYQDLLHFAILRDEWLARQR